MLRRLLLAVGTLSLVAGILACVAIVLVLTRGVPAGSPLPNVTSGPIPGPPSSVSSDPGPACRLLRRPERLADPVEPTVPILLASTADGSLVGIGFARGPRQSGELTVERETMRPSLRSTEPRKERVLGVVPMARGAELDFLVDTARSQLKNPRSLTPDLAVGATKTEFSRTFGGETHELWSLPDDARITTPYAVMVPGRGYGITFRNGGQSGKIHLGWLDAKGERASDLGTLDESGMVGTPTLAESGEQLLVAFAGRPGEGDPWTIRLGLMKFGQVTTRSQAFALPPGGPGLEAISPSAVGLPEGRWLLQWTEGATGNRQVRAQPLNPDLGPDGPPLTLSPAELNAGQGAALSSGGHVLVVFVTITKGQRELWGVTLRCFS